MKTRVEVRKRFNGTATYFSEYFCESSEKWIRVDAHSYLNFKMSKIQQGLDYLYSFECAKDYLDYLINSQLKETYYITYT